MNNFLFSTNQSITKRHHPFLYLYILLIYPLTGFADDATIERSTSQKDSAVLENTADKFPEAQLISYIIDFPSGPDIIDPDLQYRVGMLYLKGNGLPQNIYIALSWLEKAAENKSAIAQYTLGMLYKDGNYDIKKNRSRAYKWLKKASRQGLPSAIKEIEFLNTEINLSLN